jgi:hypothetical protein
MPPGLSYHLSLFSLAFFARIRHNARQWSISAEAATKWLAAFVGRTGMVKLKWLGRS